jgi:hypothetical protein
MTATTPPTLPRPPPRGGIFEEGRAKGRGKRYFQNCNTSDRIYRINMIVIRQLLERENMNKPKKGNSQVISLKKGVTL